MTTFLVIIGVVILAVIVLFALLVFGMVSGESSFDRMVREQKEEKEAYTQLTQDLESLVDHADTLSESERESKLRAIETDFLENDPESSRQHDVVFVAAAKMGLEDVALERLDKVYVPSVAEKLASDASLNFLQHMGMHALSKGQYLPTTALSRIMADDSVWVSNYIDQIVFADPKDAHRLLMALYPVATPEIRVKAKALATATIRLNDDVLNDIVKCDELDELYVDAASLVGVAVADLSKVTWDVDSPLKTGLLLAQSAAKIQDFDEETSNETSQRIVDHAFCLLDNPDSDYGFQWFFQTPKFQLDDASCALFVRELMQWCRDDFSRQSAILSALPADRGLDAIYEELLPSIVMLASLETPHQLTEVHKHIQRHGAIAVSTFLELVKKRRAEPVNIEQLGLYSFLATEFEDSDALEAGINIISDSLDASGTRILGIRVCGDVLHRSSEPVLIVDGVCEDGEPGARHPSENKQSGHKVYEYLSHVDVPLTVSTNNPIDSHTPLDQVATVLGHLAGNVEYLTDLFDQPCEPWCEPFLSVDDFSVTSDYDEYVVGDEDNRRYDPDDERIFESDALSGYNPITGEGVAARPDELYWGTSDPASPFKIRVILSKDQLSEPYIFDFPFTQIDRLITIIKSQSELV